MGFIFVEEGCVLALWEDPKFMRAHARGGKLGLRVRVIGVRVRSNKRGW